MKETGTSARSRVLVVLAAVAVVLAACGGDTPAEDEAATQAPATSAADEPAGAEDEPTSDETMAPEGATADEAPPPADASGETMGCIATVASIAAIEGGVRASLLEDFTGDVEGEYAGYVAELDEFVATAPPELTGTFTSIRDTLVPYYDELVQTGERPELDRGPLDAAYQEIEEWADANC